MELEIAGKVAIVTGGAQGLGKAVCIGLAREGAKVVVNDLRLSEATDEVVNEIKALGGEAIAVAADVSSEEAVEALFAGAVEAFGRVDILVNNAGVWPTAYVKDMDLADWQKTVGINLTGPFLTCRTMVRHLTDRKSPGKIVNVVSQAAFHGSTSGHAHYASAKGGLVTFTVSLAREVAPRGINVNAVAPGMMVTSMSREALTEDPDRYLARIPLGRIAEPAEVADVVVFLCSRRAGYMTGATVDVTGGMLMR